MYSRMSSREMSDRRSSGVSSRSSSSRERGASVEQRQVEQQGASDEGADDEDEEVEEQVPKRVASVSTQRSASRPMGSSASMSMRMGSWHLQLAPAHTT